MTSVPILTETHPRRPMLTVPLPAPTTCDVTELTPDRGTAWDRYVTLHPDGTLFHTLAWRRAVSETFGHRAIYLTAARGGRIVGALPLFLVAGRIAGRRLVSVPYAVGGGVMADDGEAAARLFDGAKRIAGEHRCPIIDFRSECATIPDLPIVDRYVGFRRELPDRVGDVLEWLPRKARAAARLARDKHRLTVSFSDEHLSDVWRLYSISMRRLASLTYPQRFFERLVEYTPRQHWVCLVEWDRRPVAGLVTFLFRDTVMPYFVGTTDAARLCHAANFIYFCVMMRAVHEGYRIFDFGRSRRDNTGSYDFKRFNGFEPRPLGYQMYRSPGAAVSDLSPSNRRFHMARRLWPRLPLWLTQTIGARLSRHVPG